MNVVPVVVFVCNTNLVRSPAAAGMFAAHAATSGLAVIARSAGTHAVHGSPADARLRRAAGPALGCLSVHRSVPFAGEVATGADLVLCMEAEQLDAVVRSYPHLAPKAFTWRGFLDVSTKVAPRGGSVAAWVAAVHDRRVAATDEVAASSAEQPSVAPLRRGPRAHRKLLREVDGLAARTAALLAAASLPVASTLRTGAGSPQLQSV